MSDILLTDEYKVVVDDYNHTLFQYKTINKGKENAREEWVSMEKYFPTLRSAICWLYEHRAESKKQEQTLKEYLHEVTVFFNLMEETLNEQYS